MTLRQGANDDASHPPPSPHRLLRFSTEKSRACRLARKHRLILYVVIILQRTVLLYLALNLLQVSYVPYVHTDAVIATQKYVCFRTFGSLLGSVVFFVFVLLLCSTRPQILGTIFYFFS